MRVFKPMFESVLEQESGLGLFPDWDEGRYVAPEIEDGPEPSEPVSSESPSADQAARGMCRICYDDASEENCVRACACSGTMGLVHSSCLGEWLRVSGGDRCELCGQGFIMRRQFRPPRDWMSPGWSADERFELSMLAVLFPLTVIALCCGVSVLYLLAGPAGFFLTSTHYFLCLLCGLAYVVCPLVALKYGMLFYSRHFVKFVTFNQDVTVFGAQ